MDRPKRQKYSRWDKENTKELMRWVLTDSQMREKMETLICKQFPEMQKKSTKLGYGFVKKLASKVGIGIKDSRGLSIKLINIAKSLHCKSELKTLLERGWHVAENLGLLEKQGNCGSDNQVGNLEFGFNLPPENILEELLEEICLQIQDNHYKRTSKQPLREKSATSHKRNVERLCKSPSREPIDFGAEMIHRERFSPDRISRIDWDCVEFSEDSEVSGQRFKVCLTRIRNLSDQRDRQLFGDLLSSTKELYDQKFRENPDQGQQIMGLFYQCIDKCLPSFETDI